MVLHRALSAAALVGAAALSVPALAQDAVPPPPPAGVPGVPRRVVQPDSPPPVQQPAPSEQSNSLPQLPDNPIRLEPERKPIEAPVVPSVAPQVDQNVAVTPPPVAPPAAAPVARRPVTPKGPVYYFPHDPFAFPANVTTPPGMHIPNSPYVEDLSVAGDHGRYTYYSYRRPWYTPGQLSANVTIIW